MQTKKEFARSLEASVAYLVITMILCFAASALAVGKDGAVSRSVAVNAVLPAGATPGERPYEIMWSGRKEPKNTQVAFDSLEGWTMTAVGDAQVGLCASVEQQLWRPQLAKLTYGGGTTATTVEITPPSPVNIAGPFDAVNIWLYGGNVREQDKPLQIDVIVEDAAGHEFTIKTAAVTTSYWNIQHGLLAPQALADAKFPMKFKRLVIANCRAAGPRSAYLESISFYKQSRNPEQSKWVRPKNPVFPVTDQGILPTPPAGITTSVNSAGKGAEFVSTGPDGVLRFTIRPEEGVLNGVTARWNDGPVFRPMADGGVLRDHGREKPEEPAVISSSLKSGKLNVRWRSEKWGSKPVVWQAGYSLRGRTLVVDVKCAGGVTGGLSFGKLSGLTKPKGIEVPYLLMGDKPGPWIGCAGGLFVSVLPDWYNSDFSSVNTAVEQPSESTIGLIGGTRYDRLSDGKRIDMRDRVLVTVSPEFADTLPNSQNPPSINRDRLAKYMLFMSAQWCPTYFDTLKSYGVDNMIANHFGLVYTRNYSENGFARWRPRPDVTEAQLKAYFDHIRSLGYIPGTYMESLLISPTNEFWDENKLFGCVDGTWCDGWYGAYVVDPNWWVELVRNVGEKTKKLFGPGSVYLDQYTCGGLGATSEAGTEGVGMARHNVMCVGDAILEARKWYGSTFSEGYYRWLYAGLTDFDYATIITTGTAADKPLLPDFDLLKIHPFETGTMMGYQPDTFLSQAEASELLLKDDGRGVGSTAFHKYVCASLAYGHGLMLGYGYWPPLSRVVQYYALFEGVQSEYCTDRVAEIRYHNGTRFLTTSAALAEGAEKMGRVKVTYSRGLVVYANYNAAADWTVSANGRRYVLPPYGWVIVKPRQILSYSALIDGNRVDYVQAPDYYYMNTGGATATDGPIDLNGAVYVKREGSEWRIIPCAVLGKADAFHPVEPAIDLWDYRFIDPPADRGCSRVFIDVKTLLGNVAQVRVSSINESGKVISSETRQVGNGHIEFAPVSGVKEYRISPS